MGRQPLVARGRKLAFHYARHMARAANFKEERGPAKASTAAGVEKFGVFLNTLTGVLGDYVTVSSMETFAASKSDRHPTDLAMLRGARLVTAQETEEGGAWNETRIKALTGGDSITARFMRQDFFTFNPTFKLVIAGNHKPILRSVDDANRLQYHPLHQQAYGRRQAPAGKTQGGVAGHTALGDRGMRRMA
jgi:hypothetical protein